MNETLQIALFVVIGFQVVSVIALVCVAIYRASLLRQLAKLKKS